MILENDVLILFLLTRLIRSIGALTKLGDLSEAPVKLLIVCFIAIFDLFLVIQHRCRHLVSRVHLIIIRLILFEFLLEADFETCLKEIFFQLLGRLYSVSVNTSSLDLKLLHVFLSTNLTVHSRTTCLVVGASVGRRALAFEYLERLVLFHWLRRRMLRVHLLLGDVCLDSLLVDIRNAVPKSATVSEILPLIFQRSQELLLAVLRNPHCL